MVYCMALDQLTNTMTATQAKCNTEQGKLVIGVLIVMRNRGCDCFRQVARTADVANGQNSIKFINVDDAEGQHRHDLAQSIYDTKAQSLAALARLEQLYRETAAQ